MGGQVQQPNNASQYDRNGGNFPGSYTGGDAADAAMTRWLQSAGLQHLASPSIDPRHFPNLIPQDVARNGNLDERKKLFRLIRSISGGLEPSSELLTPARYSSGRRNAVDELPSSELHGEIGGGILDLHSIDDIELLTEDVMHEPFEVSPFVAVTEKGFDNEPEALWSFNKPLNKQRTESENSPMRASVFEKEVPGKDMSAGLARIRVVVRKRPLNKKEIARKEEDIVIIDSNGFSLAVHEPKLKVDLTAYVEKHDFVFDAVLDEQVSNDEVYRETVQPIIPTIFQRTKATCFAYGQTGSGKTFTMQPLPLRACQDILDLMLHPMYRNEGLQLWLSFFEIYGGKLYDLLTDRRKLCMREDGRQQVCIVGLKEFPVSNVEIVKEYIEKGNASRSTGSTGANEESSRSHAILQLVIKKHSNKKDERMGKLVGKFSFIDLAGSERGADTTDNDRQTRIEGAEINKSLLALKECIRALDHEQGHIPFRGSKLTEVLRDSFVGDSRTVMISCISPSTGSCEHTLNTLRYADRVKGLSKNGNAKRDPSPNIGLQMQRDMVPNCMVETDKSNDFRVPEPSKNSVDQVNWHSQIVEQNNWTSYQGSIHGDNVISSSFSNERDRPVVRESVPNFSHQWDSTANKNEQDTISPSKWKAAKDVKPHKHESDLLNNDNITLRGKMPFKDQMISSGSQLKSKDTSTMMTSQNGHDGHISAILEEEEDLIAAHRVEVEETMELVREEMRLLTEMDQPGSRVDRYVSQLSYLLSRKAAGIVNLQTRLARFQRHLKEQEVMSQHR